jgi:tRNA-binding EMAP/Myf-like protein
VLEVAEHPDADKLYVLQISLGEEKRQLVAGLRKYVKREELLGRHIVVVANLEKAKLRGEESCGMLLAAVKDDALQLVQAPGSEPGMRVYSEGVESKPVPKASIEEYKEVGLCVKHKRIVASGLDPLRTEKEILKVEIPDGAKVE